MLNVSKHASLAVTSYPKQFSFKKGRIKSISSLFSSFTIGSRRTYSSKEKSILHVTIIPLPAFLGFQETELLILLYHTREKRYTVHARLLLKIALTITIYSSKEYKYLQLTSSKECLLHKVQRYIFICNFDLCHVLFTIFHLYRL